MKDKVGLALTIGVMASVGLLAASCSSSNTSDTAEVSGEFNVTQVAVNGKQVTCITWGDYKKGGLSCDWANAR